MSYESYPASPPPPPPPGGGVPSRDAGFFAALFDFSFSSFVTPMIVRVVYVLGMVLIVLGWLGLTVAEFSQNTGGGIAVLIFGALGALVYLAFFRMGLEFLIAVVRMSEDIHKRLPRT